MTDQVCSPPIDEMPPVDHANDFDGHGVPAGVELGLNLMKMLGAASREATRVLNEQNIEIFALVFSSD